MHRRALALSGAVGGALLLNGARASGQTMTPITLTGFNEDLIAEAAPASATTTAGFDAYNNYALYAAGYPGAAAGTGLPDNGTIVSAANPNTTFQLAPFTSNNALEFNPSNDVDAPNVSSGSVTLVSPNAYTNLAFLSAATNNKASDIIVATLNFSDGSSYTDSTTTDANTTSFAGQDWFNGTNDAIDNLGRVDREGDSPEDDDPNPMLYENDITLPAADQTKILTSVSLTTTGSGYAWALFGLSGAVNGNGTGIIVWDGKVGGGSLDTTTPNFQGSPNDVPFSPYNSIVFDDTAGGTTTVTVTAAGVNPATVAFNNSSKSYVINGGAFNATGGLTVNGGGTATLNNPNSFPVGTTLNSGTLIIGSTGSLSTPILNVSSGTTFTVQAGGAITGQSGAPLQLLGSGTINLTGTTLQAGSGTNYSGTLWGSGGLNLSGGTVTAGSNTFALTGPVTVGNGASLVINSSSPVGGGTTVVLSGTGVSANGALRGADYTTASWAGNINVSGPVQISPGFSGTLTLSGAITGSGPVAFAPNSNASSSLSSIVLSPPSGSSNTYTGESQISGGGSSLVGFTIQLGNHNGFSSASGLNFVGGAGPVTVDLSGFNQTVTYLAGSAASGSALTNSNSTLSTLTITNGNNASAVAQSFNTPITGNIALVKTGAGNQILSGANSYSGGTTISAGTLTAPTPSALGNGPVTLSGGTLNLSVGVGNLSGFSGMALNGGATVSNNVLTLTDGNGSEARSAFTSTQAVLTDAAGFTASFLYTPNGSADGVTFTIQNDPRGNAAVGGNGGGLGYSSTNGGDPIINSLSVQFNIYGGGAGAGIGVATNGGLSDSTAPYNFDSTPPAYLFMGDPFQAQLSYNGSSQTLTETLTDTDYAGGGTSYTNTNTFTYTGIDLNALLGGDLGYVGFTGGTGGLASVQTISDFTFNGGGLTSPVSTPNSISTAPNTSSRLTASVVAGLTTSTIGNLNIASGSTLTVLGIAQTPGVHLVLITPNLSIAGSVGNWTGKLDLTNSSLDVQNGNLSVITNQVKEGFNAGGPAWQGSGGITSSTAAADTTHLTALGVIVNNVNGTQLYGSGTALGLFDGDNPGSNDVLVKYTYYGDANLSGVVDASDYSLIDDAYLQEQTSGSPVSGWYNGDFNYDGVVNGSDYTLIDNAFNMQGASLAGELASPSAQATTQLAQSSPVPEPASLGLLTACAAGLLGRRRRGS